jgi:two-component system, NarL family, invasion response regulator UvrY
MPVRGTPRFLIVDDHEVVRRGLGDMLGEAFPLASLESAPSVASALETLSAKNFDLVLLDINLPGRIGFDLLEEARRRWPRLPVLVLSAYPEDEFAIRSIRLGAAGYLTKESAADELVAAVRKVLAGGKYVRPALAERLASFVGGELSITPHELLSGRELQVLRLVANARTLKEIAAELGLSEKTIATYRARVSEKLGVSSNVELARYAVRHKLVD